MTGRGRARILVAAAALGWSLTSPSTGSGAVTISSVSVGGHEGRLQVEIRSSEPVSYLLSEKADPFSVTLYFLNASFGFPTGEKAMVGAGLSAVVASVLERDGSRLGRLDLRFTETAPYRVVQERNRLFVRVDLPSPPATLLLGRPGEKASPSPTPPTQPSRTQPPPGGTPPAGVSLILNVTTERHGDKVRVFVDADGPLTFKSFTTTEPPRVVVDFEGAVSSLDQETLPVSGSLLKRIRVSQHNTDTARIVFDLARPHPFWIEKKERGVVVHLGDRPPR